MSNLELSINASLRQTVSAQEVIAQYTAAGLLGPALRVADDMLAHLSTSCHGILEPLKISFMEARVCCLAGLARKQEAAEAFHHSKLLIDRYPWWQLPDQANVQAHFNAHINRCLNVWARSQASLQGWILQS